MEFTGSKIVYSFVRSASLEVAKSCQKGTLNFKPIAIVFAVFLTLCTTSFAKDYEDGIIQTNAKIVDEYKSLVKGTSFQIDEKDFLEKKRQFSAKQLSHILRVNQLMQDVIDDPDFENQFGDWARDLKANREKVAKQGLLHDSGKFMRATGPANDVLAMADKIGFRDLRTLAEGNPEEIKKLKGPILEFTPEKAKRIQEILRTSIDDMNIGEARFINQGYRKIGATSKFRAAMDDFVEMIDYNDVAINRQGEMGVKTANTLDWSKKLMGEKASGWVLEGADAETKARINQRLKLAEFLDKKEYLVRNASRYTQPIDFLRIPTKGNFQSTYERTFHERSDGILKDAKGRANRDVRLAKAGTNKSVAAQSSKGADAVEDTLKTAKKAASSVKVDSAVASSTSVTSAESVAAAAATAGAARSALARAAQFAAKNLKAIGAGAILTESIVYLIDPEDTNLNKIMESLVTNAPLIGSQSLAECTTLQCGQFINECGRKLECLDIKNDLKRSHCIDQLKQANSRGQAVPWPKMTFPEITGHEKYASACVASFLSQPLQVQSKAREDQDLNKLLSPYSPRIHDLTCSTSSQGELSANLEYGNSNRNRMNSDNYFQKLVFNSAKKLEKIERIPVSEPNVKDSLSVNSDQKIDVLTHCVNGRNCRKLPMEDIKNIKLGFWRDDRIQAVNSDYRVPIDAVKWARLNNQVIEFQATQVRECCGDKSCKGFFSERKSNVNRIIKSRVKTVVLQDYEGIP